MIAFCKLHSFNAIDQSVIISAVSELWGRLRPLSEILLLWKIMDAFGKQRAAAAAHPAQLYSIQSYNTISRIQRNVNAYADIVADCGQQRRHPPQKKQTISIHYNARINRQNKLSNLPRQHRRLMDTNNTTTHTPPLPVPPSKFHHISTIYRQSKDLLEETIGL